MLKTSSLPVLDKECSRVMSHPGEDTLPTRTRLSSNSTCLKKPTLVNQKVSLRQAIQHLVAVEPLLLLVVSSSWELLVQSVTYTGPRRAASLQRMLRKVFQQTQLQPKALVYDQALFSPKGFIFTCSG